MIAGNFLTATSLLNETFFEAATILITGYNKEGATGFVINKLFPRKLNELEEFRHGAAFPIYDGGPVDREHLFFIHQRPDLINDGVNVAGKIFFGGDFNSALAHINNGKLTSRDIMIFLGYCGWNNNELGEEVKEGSWSIVNDAPLFR